MLFYKTMQKRLDSCGWIITDESHEKELNESGRIYPHYFKYNHPADTDGEREIEMVCSNNKDGSPGKILKLWQGGKPCRV